MNMLRFLVVFLFIWQGALGMNDSNIAKALETIKQATKLKMNEKKLTDLKILPDDVKNLSFYPAILLNHITLNNDLSIMKKIKLFQWLVYSSKYLKKIFDDQKVTSETQTFVYNSSLKDPLIAMIKKEKLSIEPEELFIGVNKKIQSMTTLDDKYFYRKYPASEEIEEIAVQKSVFSEIKKHFITCTQLSFPLIQTQHITDEYILNGPVGENLPKCNFYNLAEQIRHNILLLSNVQNEIGSVPKLISSTEYFAETVIEPELVNKFIELFIIDCLSRAKVTNNNVSEQENKKQFFWYFEQINRDSDWNNNKKFALIAVIKGALCGIPRSDNVNNQEYKNKIENFTQLISLAFPILTQNEKQELNDFFKISIASFQTIYARNNDKLQALIQFEQLIEKITAEPVVWKTKFAIALLLSSSIVYLAYKLKHHQQLFNKYPLLQKLLPFLYQKPTPIKQLFFRKLFGN